MCALQHQYFYIYGVLRDIIMSEIYTQIKQDKVWAKYETGGQQGHWEQPQNDLATMWEMVAGLLPNHKKTAVSLITA